MITNLALYPNIKKRISSTRKNYHLSTSQEDLLPLILPRFRTNRVRTTTASDHHRRTIKSNTKKVKVLTVPVLLYIVNDIDNESEHYTRRRF